MSEPLMTLMTQMTLMIKIKEKLACPVGAIIFLHQVDMIYHQQKKYPEAFENYQIAFSILTELQSPDAQITANKLSVLRKDWGEKEFEGRKKDNYK